MSFIITLTAVLVGLMIIFWVIKASKKKQMNEIHALVWLVGAVGLIALGIFPEIMIWVADAIDVFWPPSILIFFLLVLAFFMLFSHSKSVSVLANQVTELTMNLSLLKHENEKLKKIIEENNKEQQ